MFPVLVVDDDPEIQWVLGKYLQSEGAEVHHASSADDAISVVRNDVVPAVALCDLRMPGKDGLWLAGRFQTESPTTAVVMTTGVHDFDAAVRSLQAGAVDYVTKPFAKERLQEALRRAMRAHSRRRAAVPAGDDGELGRALMELEANGWSALEAMVKLLAAFAIRVRSTAPRARLACRWRSA
jgi:DNA-binding NtrC family response regulator